MCQRESTAALLARGQARALICKPLQSPVRQKKCGHPRSKGKRQQNNLLLESPADKPCENANQTKQKSSRVQERGRVACQNLITSNQDGKK